VVFHIRANRRQNLGRANHIIKLCQKDSGGGACGPAVPAAVSPPQRPVDPGDGGGWPALAAQAAVSPPQGPVDSGDGGDWTALAAQAAAAGTVAKDCKDAVSTRRLAAGSTNSLWLRKKSTPMMANVTSARRNVHSNRRPWKSSCTAPLAPTRYLLAARPGQERPTRRRRGAMRKYAVTCTSINQKTPARKLVHVVNQLPRGDGVQTPPGY
jgi:hypothetical protein